MRGKSIFTIKSFFFLFVLVCGLNFSAYSQTYSFDKTKEPLAQALLDSKIWDVKWSNYIQEISNEKGKTVRVFLYDPPFNPKVVNTPIGSKNIEGQKVRDAIVIHQAYRLWRIGKLENAPNAKEIRKLLAKQLNSDAKLFDEITEENNTVIWDKVLPFYQITSGYMVGEASK